MPPVNALKVAVVGLGTMGSQVAWQLARRDADVLGFETLSPGHGEAAAGGDNRIFRSAHFEDSRYIPILRRADELFDELAAESGRELRGFPGCLLMGPPDHHQMATVLASVDDHALDVERIDERSLRERFPQFRMDPGDVAVLDRRAGYIRPELTVRTAARMAERAGASLHSRTRVTAIEPGARGVVVRAGDQSFTVDRVVVTAGAWVRELVPDVSPFLTARRPISAWFLRDPLPPGTLEPAFIRTAPRHFYGVPAFDGISYKLGLSVVDHLIADDADRVERRPDWAELEPFREIIARYLPMLEASPVRVNTYLESYTDDSRPVVGLLERDPRIVVLGGFSGHGFKIAPAIGEAGADLAIAGATSLPIGFLARPGFSSDASAELTV